MRRKTHEQLIEIALSRPGVKREYDMLEAEFALIKELVKARLRAGKTQAQIAAAMHTSTSVVGRLETGGGKLHSPTINTLHKYAQAVGCRLVIKLEPFHHIK